MYVFMYEVYIKHVYVYIYIYIYIHTYIYIYITHMLSASLRPTPEATSVALSPPGIMLPSLVFPSQCSVLSCILGGLNAVPSYVPYVRL